jgi:adenosylmethionine-8-amino-7-oxononanoate aminotransferase
MSPPRGWRGCLSNHLVGAETVVFCDSGSVSGEVAVKMALQYWRGRDHFT